MKILQFPAYITINHKNFQRSVSGYGYMAADIATSIVERDIDVDLITQSNITNGFNYKNVNILTRSWFDILKYFRIAYLVKAFRVIISDRIPVKFMPNISQLTSKGGNRFVREFCKLILSEIYLNHKI